MGRVVSFVLRSGRMTVCQELGLTQYLSQYQLPVLSQGLAASEKQYWDFEQIFAATSLSPCALASAAEGSINPVTEESPGVAVCRAPLVLEIGFGMGDSLVEMAKARPHEHFVGVEVHRPGVGALLSRVVAQDITNIRVVMGDVVTAVLPHLSPATFSRIQIYFPDPWPKRRHHKRRLIQAELVARLADVLMPGGVVHVATDWADYARHIRQVFSECPFFVRRESSDLSAWSRPTTKFEMRANDVGRAIEEFFFERV